MSAKLWINESYFHSYAFVIYLDLKIHDIQILVNPYLKKENFIPEIEASLQIRS